MDRDGRRRHLAQGFGCQQHADPRGGAPEVIRRRSLVAKVDERVLDQRVIDDVDRHGPTLYNFSAACAYTTE
jgi:hypothetical protein